jgi:predicted transcriptional regulator of viral defense system
MTKKESKVKPTDSRIMRRGDAEALRASAKQAAGYPRLDPTLPARGKYNRRWGLLIN